MLTEDWGEQVGDQRESEAERVYAEKVPEPAPQVVRIDRPIQGQANVSTDGGIVVFRGEGWKEVKMSVISAVTFKPVAATALSLLRTRRLA